MEEFIRRLISLRHRRWVYVLPTLHLLACTISDVGLVVPQLQFLGIVWSFIMLADLPISLLAYALAFRSTPVAALWIFVLGTLWWYFLSCVIEHFKGEPESDSHEYRL